MQDSEPPRKAAIGALVLVVMIVIGSLWLQRHMRANGLIEDCMMQGRKNCVPMAQ